VNSILPVLKLFRFPLVFTAIADSVTGYLFTVEGPADGRVVFCLALASAGLYCFGMAMNDIADRERDKTLAPGRVLPSGKLSLGGAVAAALGALAVSLAMVILAPGASLGGRLAAWGGMVAFILAYDFGPKIPLFMGAIRALNVVLGGIAGQGLAAKGIAPLIALAVPVFVYVTGLTFASTMEEGKIRRPLLFAWTGVMAAGALLSVVMTSLFGDDWGTQHAWFFSIALSGWLGWRAFRASDRKGVMLLVRDGVAGIIVVHAARLFADRLNPEGFSVLALLIPAILLVAWFKKLG
jgi:4-hydroxybenzoate polyprenyltransferase